METTSRRFERPSSGLRLESLLKRTRVGLWGGLPLALSIHIAFSFAWRRDTASVAAKPLTTQFVKRQPRLTKPLELKKRPQPKQRHVQRRMVSVKARMQREEGGPGVRSEQVLGGLAEPRVRMGRLADFASVEIEPTSRSAVVGGSKEVQQKIDMSLELLDIEALDTGEYHALVVQDPQDKRSVKGFCRLALVYSEFVSRRLNPNTGQTYFDTAVTPVLRTLTLAMNRYTNVRTDILGRITLDDAELFKTPWVYAYAPFNFRASENELMGLGKYLTSGGFVFADTIGGLVYRGGFRGMSTTMIDALRTQGISEPVFQKLPSSHAIYHCYFDFDSPPVAADAPVEGNRGKVACPDFLEGIQLDGRLSVILSRKGYYGPWGGTWGTPRGGSYRNLDPTPALQFGVNLIIFALTQEGSITHRLMEAVGH